MTTYPRLQAVMEINTDAQNSTFPWAMADLPALKFLRLSGENTPTEIGLVVAQLINYNHLESPNDVVSRLRSIADRTDRLLLPGGLMIGTAQQVIIPGCCCGLETWRDWVNFAATGQSPWTGHDPSSWAEILDTRAVRIWSDQGLAKFHIDFSERQQFRSALLAVHQDLMGFLERLASWATSLGFVEVDRLVAAVDRHFSISDAVFSDIDLDIVESN